LQLQVGEISAVPGSVHASVCVCACFQAHDPLFIDNFLAEPSVLLSCTVESVAWLALVVQCKLTTMEQLCPYN